MKMQELITEFRDEVPRLAKHHQEVSQLYLKVGGLWDDLRRCESATAQGLLMDAACEAMNRFAQAYVDLSASIEALERLNAEYKEKLGPRNAGPKEDPRQMELNLEPSPASQTDSANAAITGGRHG